MIIFSTTCSLNRNLGPIVHKVDSAIHWLNTIQQIIDDKTYFAIHQTEFYPADSDIHPLIN